MAAALQSTVKAAERPSRSFPRQAAIDESRPPLRMTQALRGGSEAWLGGRAAWGRQQTSECCALGGRRQRQRSAQTGAHLSRSHPGNAAMLRSDARIVSRSSAMLGGSRAQFCMAAELNTLAGFYRCSTGKAPIGGMQVVSPIAAIVRLPSRPTPRGRVPTCRVCEDSADESRQAGRHCTGRHFRAVKKA